MFWPKLKLTKGDLFRYYVEAAPFILPAVADRPLVMKRFPNGIARRTVLPAPRDGRRRRACASKHVREADGSARPQIVGGDLTTLLYMTQLAAISQDPWFSRVARPTTADYVALDLDPMPDVPFAQVLDVARWIRDELATLGAVGFPKTSGADGAHIYIPLPPGTPYEAGLLFCQIVATVVAQKHPKQATVERSVKARGTPRVRRLPAEHSRQDAGDRVQRARQRVRRRLDAADVEGDRRRRRARGVHDRHDAGSAARRSAISGRRFDASKGVDLDARRPGTGRTR